MEIDEGGTVIVGRILGPWGRHGAMRVLPLTDVPDRLAPERRVMLRGREVLIRECFSHRSGLVLSLSGIDRLEQAEALRGEVLYVPREQVPRLDEGRYYHFQILGLQVLSDEGEHLGEISEIITTGANDVYVVRTEGAELLVPAIEEVIKEIDLEKNQMVIELIDGL